MTHENLIVALASDITPVTPLRAPAVRMLRWVACALAFVGVGIAWRGLRENWAGAFAEPFFIATLILICGIAWVSAFAAFKLSVPGALRTSVVKWLPIAGLAAWGALLMQQVAQAGSLTSSLVSEPIVAGCLAKTYGIAAVPAVLIVLLARRAAPLDWRWTAGLAGLSALAFGVIGTELICPLVGHAHLFNSHFLPVAVMTIVAFVAGEYLQSRDPRA